MSQIETEKQQDTLYLIGELDTNSLNTIWRKQPDLLSAVTSVDVSKLVRVDSAGLALLVYFCNAYNVKLQGINPQLQKLIELYDLEPVIMDASSASKDNG
ncbi:phospholipid ABC transporter substrate-binding protein [Orbaceae bacterium ESL0727]|nr:phospholipid ABC transporter substrate-binding protein [Orbaceae bacterium ESL0727]